MSGNVVAMDPEAVTPSALDEVQIPEALKNYGRELCRELSTMPNPGSKGKYDTTMVPKSYQRKDWDNLDPKQRLKVIQVWNELPQAQKDQLMVKIMSSGAPAVNISPNTNKNDKARVLHMLCDPTHTARFTAAVRVKDRLGLDDTENPDDHYGHLADCFNNYAGYPYRNVTAKFAEDNYAGDGPEPGYETAYEMCRDINPTAGLQTRPVRGGDWFIAQLREFKVDWTKAYNNYKLSGNHDAENPIEEFSKFCFGNELLMYAFVLFHGEDGANLNELLGKTLPDYAAGDTGVLSPAGANALAFTSPVAKSSKSNNSRASAAAAASAQPRKIILDIPGYSNAPSGKTDQSYLADEKDEFDLNYKLAVTDAKLTEAIKQDALWYLLAWYLLVQIVV